MTLAFFLAAPILIGYGIGWRYNSTSRHLEKVSALSITSTPRGASVYVNNELQQKQTPFSINHLYASNYQVKLEKSGYYAWEKNVRTYADRVTRLPNAYLVKKQNFEASILTTPIESMYVSPSGSRIMIAHQLELTAYLQTGIRQWEYRLPAEVADIQWSADESLLLVTTASSSTPLVINSYDGSRSNFALPDTGTIYEYFWSQDVGTILYCRTNQAVYEINLARQITQQLPEPPIQKYGDTSLRIMRDLELATWETSDGELIASLPVPILHTLKIVASGHFLFVQDATNRSLFTIDVQTRQSKPLGKNIIATMWGAERKQLLYASSNELWLYDPQTVTQELILRTSQEITNAQLMINDQYIGYVPGGQNLTLFEISDLPRNTYVLPTDKTTGLVTLPNRMTAYLSTETEVFPLVFE
ncbi:MAG: PEGA domain-containing protein [Candidatus Kerfeldbacteria bacterium]|nr:PEGA domain-containing protein [Candidatus Kerfeldbacteria bacterium]